MSNVLTRILLFAVAVPGLYALALLAPFMHYLPLSLVVAVFSAGAAWELAAILEPGCGMGRRTMAAAAALCVSALAWGIGFVPSLAGLSGYALAVGASALGVMAMQAVGLAFPAKAENIPASARGAMSMALYALYPGAMAAALLTMLAQPGGGKLLVWYSLVSFSNDSLAWLVGITMGRKRGLFKVSPNKSLEGFVAGMAASVAAAMLGPVLFPDLVPARWALLAALGVVCGLAVVVGDLFESALKRSAGVKDSGASIPGRGGFLDSFDSIAFAAPVFAVFAMFLGLM